MNYKPYADKARNKLAQKGGDCILTRKGSEEVYNPATNEYTSYDITINGKALQNRESIFLQNGTSIQAGDLLLMAVFDSAPINTDKLTFGGKTYTIVAVEPFCPDGNEVIYYDIQAR